MWIKYRRVLNEVEKQWVHPDFTTDGRTSEKYLSPQDNTLFLANTTVEDFSGYDGFNIETIPDEMLAIEKRKFGVNTIIPKYAFRQRLTYEENYKISNYVEVIDGQAITEEERNLRKGNIKTVMDMFNASEAICLTDESMSDFALIFVNCEILTADRIKEILS